MSLFLTILGTLPASSAQKGELSHIDYLKLLRMAFTMAVSYSAIAVLQSLIGDLSNGSLGIPQEFATPLTGVLALALEWVRRKMATPTI